MNAITKFGKYLFAIPFLLFGVFHFMGAQDMASMAPGGAIMVYLTGAAHIAAAVSIFIGKYDKLATFLLGVMLLLFIIAHIQMMGNDDLPEMVRNTQPGEILKNVALAGAAWMYSHSLSRDNSVMG